MTTYEHYTYFCPTCWQPLTEDAEARIIAPKGKLILTDLNDWTEVQTELVTVRKENEELKREVAFLKAEAAFKTVDHGDN
ncbi:hypothetical protein VK792_19465 [Mesobacterium sp. TK19101]|uniref:Uncharacterized protein n=1 Tax=Mesobacterium hydrothermale TaxID=3111907 RepID=A0ABU6HLY5_9RHOB|nr:hypothetical protein [Mesobacterium sp. TK19101]MEC3863463.1 hypothetical protein [Mesobacterium sp. TK19101]